MTSALAFESASKRYRNGVLALDAVSFSIEEGARTCLLGPNGAGKSTAIRLLQGALRPTQGRVTLLGATLDEPRYAEARRRTGIVPQRPGMYPDVTVDEYLTLARRLYGRGDLDATIEAFGLGPHRSKTLASLSGGFQRRVVLAAALLSQPDVLLLDEPTVGLDPVASHDVEAMLRDALLALGVVLVFPFFAIGVTIPLILNVISAWQAVLLLLPLGAALVCSTCVALVLALLAKDFRTANNLNGVLFLPIIMLMAGLLLAVPGESKLVVMSGALLGCAALALVVATGRISFERYLE